MKKLYEKNEILFAVLWIAAYCLISIPIRGELGDESPWMLLELAALAAGASLFIRANGLQSKYGLQGWPKDARPYLYFLPMLILATGNLWGGVNVHYTGIYQVCAVLSMLLIGYLEEVLFRGFLFKALLKKDGPVLAVIISAVTFGIGHIVNLLAGQADPETVVQVFFAIAWGFIFTLAFYKSGSLWPCVLVHGLVDAFSKFSRESMTLGWVYMGVAILVSILYCLYLLRQKTAENNAGKSVGS